MIQTVIYAITFLLLSDSLRHYPSSKDSSLSTDYARFGGSVVPTAPRSSLVDVGNTLLKTAVQLTTLQTLIFSGKRSAVASLESASIGEQIDLNIGEPAVTDTCFMDIAVGDNGQPQRIEIGLYGDITPLAAQNFKALCKNELGWGYKESDIFRIVSTFSVQGGNIGQPPGASRSQLGKFGRSGLNESVAGGAGLAFPAENYRIMHSYRDAGVISMMKDVSNKGYQDSRFFITTSPAAGWADGRYCAFGRVTKGMDVIQALQLLPVQPPTNYPVVSVKMVDSGCY